MGDWGVVEGVGYLCVAKGHLISGQAREKEGGMAVWDRDGNERVLKDPCSSTLKITSSPNGCREPFITFILLKSDSSS